MSVAEPATPLLQVRDLKKHFPITKGFLNRVVGAVKAVDGVSFDVLEGECLGLVGESGSGKTTVGRCILRALDPTEGVIRFRVDDTVTDVATADYKQLKELRQHMQLIFQDPYASLNPRMTVFDIVGEPLLVNGMKDRTQRELRVRELLAQVGLNPQHLQRYPHAFSGGQRQRIGIARGLALNPRLIVADEPVSALDVSVQAQILNLMNNLQRELGLTYLFIAHDLSVVRHICDRVAVMYLGRIVELAPTEDLFHTPRHPYTRSLLDAAPVPDPSQSPGDFIEGEVADPANPPPGCAFHPRCPYAEDRCRSQEPELRQLDGRWVSCHRAEELELTEGVKNGR
jgi:oligopeptide/dipeptide ABC transporter ATP-binding protein